MRSFERVVLGPVLRQFDTVRRQHPAAASEDLERIVEPFDAPRLRELGEVRPRGRRNSLRERREQVGRAIGVGQDAMLGKFRQQGEPFRDGKVSAIREAVPARLAPELPDHPTHAVGRTPHHEESIEGHSLRLRSQSSRSRDKFHPIPPGYPRKSAAPFEASNAHVPPAPLVGRGARGVGLRRERQDFCVTGLTRATDPRT